jgi:hypothetical protein
MDRSIGGMTTHVLDSLYPWHHRLLAVVIYFGLPPTLRAMGFHPHYEIPEFDLAGHRALIVTTSHDTLGETGRATGVFGSE